MGNGFFINRSLEEYEMDSFMIRLEYLLKYREIQSQIANFWRKTRSKEKFQQERLFTAVDMIALHYLILSGQVKLQSKIDYRPFMR